MTRAWDGWEKNISHRFYIHRLGLLGLQSANHLAKSPPQEHAQDLVWGDREAALMQGLRQILLYSLS